MSLIRLLAAGSSLRGIKDRPSPYKMTEQHLLPKFGSEKQAEAPVLPLPLAAGPIPGSTKELKSNGESPPEQRTEVAATELNAQVADEPQAQAKPAGSPTRQAGTPFWRWAQSKNPFSAKPVRKPRQLPAQGEFLLEGVRVVRNDLSETDLELMATVQPPPAETSGQQTPLRAPARRVWHRITERLFGGGRP